MNTLFSAPNRALNTFVRDKAPGRWILFSYEEASELIADIDHLCMALRKLEALLFTEEAIKDQIAVEEEHDDTGIALRGQS